MYVFAYRFKVVVTNRIYRRYIVIADKFAVLIIVPGRERHNFTDKPHKVFRLGGENRISVLIKPVIKRTYTYGVARGDKTVLFAVVNYKRKFRVQHFKHISAVKLIERQ